ncbi:MAG: site-specific integrase [Clostridia bacterium]|nr:site-specific integrase [Clostridia bacterium]
MTGSLQIKNGKYYAVINLTDSNGKRKQKWIATGLEEKNNKKKAEKFLRDTLQTYEKTTNISQSEILFSEYIKLWLNSVKLSVDEITYQGYAIVANSQIIPYFENKNIKLCNLNRENIQEYINIKSENGKLNGKGGLSPKTMKTHKLIIQLVIKEAIKNDLIAKNPCEYVVLPKMQRREPQFYSETQITEFFSRIKDEDIYALLYITVVYGLRRSEVLGLKWDSVNFENKTITIKHTVVCCTQLVEKDSTKTNSSYRSFPLMNEVECLLLKLKEKENANRMLFGSAYNNNEYIFKWDDGRPYLPDYVTKKFQKLLKKYDLPHIRFHDLRHSCASLLISKGFTLKDVQEWLGHADIRTTANIYAHLDITRKESIAKSMSDTFKIELC